MTGQDNGFGVSFLPNGDQRFQRPQDQPGGTGRAPLQEAVKILSMRVPRVVGANPLAPLALLNAPGSGGLQPGQLEQLMRTLGIGPQGQPGQLPTPGAVPSIGGAPSPFASVPGAPTGPLAPPSEPGGGGQPGPSPMPMPNAPAGPLTPHITVDQDANTLWELARQQRAGMGRIQY